MLPIAMNIVIQILGLTLQQFVRRPWQLLSLILVPSGLIIAIVHVRYPHVTAIAVIGKIMRDAIILLMIPYVPAFEELWSIALASIPLVSTLLITWFVFILFFAIGLTQAFGLTRFGPNETGNVNFRTVPKALILLFRMTLGEGRTKIMEDFAAIVPPYCTIGERYFEGDCGNAVLARIFFISWKVLSTYLFTSLFISLVYESFSYVSRGSSIGTGAITRDDIRQFKNAWASIDAKGTGYIPSESLTKLITQLSGRFDMRVYDKKFSVTNLRRACEYKLPLYPQEMDISRLNKELSKLPIPDTRKRRQAMDYFRMELDSTQDPKLGISMQAALVTLIYHSLADGLEQLR